MNADLNVFKHLFTSQVLVEALDCDRLDTFLKCI